MEELPCVRADMSLLLIMAGQFCPGYSSSIFSQATPYFSISISSLVQALSANLLQSFSQTREKQKRREREIEQRLGTAAQFSPASGFPKVWECRFKEPEMMQWLRSLRHELHISVLARDCLLRELPPCVSLFEVLSAKSKSR